MRRRRHRLAHVLPVATAGVLALGSSVLAADGQVVATQPPVFSAGVEVVRLDVIVLDRDGRPVTGLTAADFAVEEDGRELLPDRGPEQLTGTLPVPLSTGG